MARNKLIKGQVTESLMRDKGKYPLGMTVDEIYRDIRATTGQDYSITDLLDALELLIEEGAVLVKEENVKNFYRLDQAQKTCLLDQDVAQHCVHA